MQKAISIFFFHVLILSGIIAAHAQEQRASVRYNPAVAHAHKQRQSRGAVSRVARTTSYSLPFFEDFTGYDALPDTTKWMDDEVYVNNTMCVHPVSRGVATFDWMNQFGVPYDSSESADFSFCDSLTSVPIDLSAYSVGDSAYLSFYYQPQGNGFYPLPQDSLLLFMKITYGDWIEVWSIPGDTLQPFQQVMVPLNNPLYFFDSFQFRFVNICNFVSTDADWNLDYVYLDTGRNIYDTGVNDLAFTTDPTFMLNDYDYMPYRQFIANVAGEITPTLTDSINNNSVVTFSPNVFFQATLPSLGASLLNDAPIVNTLPSNTTTGVSDPLAGYVFPPLGGLYDRVDFNNTFSMQYAGIGSFTNDTIVKDQIFDNYLAYDDGTCEQAYLLNMDPSEPGLIATEFHVNVADTMQGVSIYFARQEPFPFNYSFDLFIYSSLHGINGATADDTLFTEYVMVPGWVDSVNHAYVYPLYRPVALPPGTFFVVTQQEAGTNDQLLYFGLDVNHLGDSHRWYNTSDNTWVPSEIAGALMIRPLLGQAVVSSGIAASDLPEPQFQAWPNPAHDQLSIHLTNTGETSYTITNAAGIIVSTGKLNNIQDINIANLIPGSYWLTLSDNGRSLGSKKFIKL